jgi:hypothetical protein
MGSGSQKIGPTADQKAQSEINVKMWDYYQKEYKPVLSKYIASRTSPLTTEAEKKKVAGQINADVMKTVKPSSATNTVVNAKNTMAAADVEASAQQSGANNVQKRQIGEKLNITNIGRGQTTKAMAGMDELASMSVNEAIQNKARGEEVAAAGENAIGSMVGTVAAAGLYGARKNKTLSNPEMEYTGAGSSNYNPNLKSNFWMEDN